MKIRVTLLVLVLSVLACMEPIATITPTGQPDAVFISDTPTLPPPTQTATIPTSTPLPLSTTQTATVKAVTVNVRQLPNGEVIGHLEAGQSVTVLECVDSWCQISDPVSGYVFQGCLSVADGQGCEAR